MASFSENSAMASNRDNLRSQSPNPSLEAERQLENFFAHLATAIKGDPLPEGKATQPTEKSGAKNQIFSRAKSEFLTQSAPEIGVPPPEMEEKNEGSGLKIEGWLDRLEPDRTEPETVVALEGLFALLKDEAPIETTAKSVKEVELSQLREMNAQLTQKLTRLEAKLDASGAQADELLKAIFQLILHIQQVEEKGRGGEGKSRDKGDKGDSGCPGGEQGERGERVWEKSWENPNRLQEKHPPPEGANSPVVGGWELGVESGAIASTDKQSVENPSLLDAQAHAQHPENSDISTPTLTPTQEELDSFPAPSEPNSKKLSLSLLSIGFVILGLIGIPFAIYQYFSQTEHRIEQKVTQALASTPDLAVYRLEADVWRKQLKLTGRLPNSRLRHEAESIAQSQAPGFPLENNIIVVEQAPDPVEVATKVQQVVKGINQIDGISISATFDAGKVTLEGSALQFTNIEKIDRAFSEIAGVEAVSNQIQIDPSSIPSRIYFNQNSDRLRSVDIDVKILPIKQLMQRYPNLQLKIVGYSHSTEYNRETLALERAQTVQNILEDRGIDRRRMQAVAGKASPQDIAPNQPRWFSRCVLFEINPGHGG